MGCAWKLIAKDENIKLKHKRFCENKECGYDSWRYAEKWAFCSEAWQVCSTSFTFSARTVEKD